MPWADEVPALLQAWYGGNENGNAIADVLFGAVNPAAKMPLTFPKRLEDIPAHGHFGNENGQVSCHEYASSGHMACLHVPCCR